MSKVLVALAAASAPLLVVAGCSSSSSTDSSATPTATTASATATATSTSTGSSAPCTSAAINAALPSGADADVYACVGDYAGVDYDTGSKQDQRAILKAENGAWTDVTSDVCGAASAGVPAEVLAYCDASNEPSGTGGGSGGEGDSGKDDNE
ncbi:MAG: hypothetical protein KDC39_14545 [Actinobacteria bacterium]|nr:hypothetical protein [Actinomycetota bacterium]